MAFTRTTTINSAPGGDSVKQAVLDLDTDLTGAFGHLNTLDSTKLATATAGTTYAPIAKGVTNGDSHAHSGGDGAQIAYSSLSGLPSLGTISSQAANNVVITGGTINGTAIGGTTPAAGAFTTLTVEAGMAEPRLDFTTTFTGDGARNWRINTNRLTYGDFAILQSTTQGGSTYAEKLVLTSTGNLLVGTTTDDGVNKLQVNGSIKATTYLINHGSGGVTSNQSTGLNALAANTTGSNNTASGGGALYNNTTGNYNTANGYQALYYNTTGSNNTANGYAALCYNTTGNYNTANGHMALYSNTTGNYNTANGYQALYYNTTGSGNICIGSLTSAGVYAPVFNCTTENDRVVIGSTGVTNAYVNVAWTVVSDQRDKTNIVDIPKGLDFVSRLNPVQYERKLSREEETGDGITRYGFLAQDILTIEGDKPVIVDAEDTDRLKLNDANLLAVVVKALQELNAKLDAHIQGA